MKTYKIIFILALSLVFSSAYAQKGKIRQASKEYDNLAYLKTSEILLEVAEKGYTSVDLLQKLANSFYFNNQMQEAAKWYGELMAKNENIDAEYYFRYAQALKSVENYEESDKWMKKFADSDRSDLRGRAFSSTVDYLAMIDEVSREFEVVNLDINTEVSDFGTSQYKDQLIFSSTRGGGQKYKWNEQPYLDLFSADKQEDGSYGNVEKLDSDINSKFHESTVAFTPDDQVMYFTRNNYYNKKYKNSEDGTNRLKLFKATLNGDKWDNVESVHFNSNEYSVAHPTINVQGTKLYFASDMEGTLGMSDIFEVEINADGSLGDPENLGPSVNTEGQETFPFINSEGDLYISSNGFNGLGGLDVFVIRDFENKRELNQPMALENVGKPINSPMDDFAYYENLGTKEGFFTSNREGGKGDDDIYSFIIPECEQTVEGVVRDQDTQEPILGAKVTLLDAETNEELNQQIVGADGTYLFEKLECEKEYLIRIEADTYATIEERFTTPKKQQKLEIITTLEKDEVELEPCADLAKILDIPIIYFDFDKSNIRRDAEVELQKVLAVLNKYPTMTIDIRSHTDCRGTATYNERLSESRAKSTRQYIIKNGIAADRLTAKGYGESRLVNDCGCEPTSDSNCSEEEHQLNRRSEFIITGINGEKCPEKE